VAEVQNSASHKQPRTTVLPLGVKLRPVPLTGVLEPEEAGNGIGAQVVKAAAVFVVASTPEEVETALARAGAASVAAAQGVVERAKAKSEPGVDLFSLSPVVKKMGPELLQKEEKEEKEWRQQELLRRQQELLRRYWWLR